MISEMAHVFDNFCAIVLQIEGRNCHQRHNSLQITAKWYGNFDEIDELANFFSLFGFNAWNASSISVNEMVGSSEKNCKGLEEFGRTKPHQYCVTKM